jgi:mono/diheme cytochrome c family protein
MKLKVYVAVIFTLIVAFAAHGQSQPAAQLAWSAEHLETNATFTQPAAQFIFSVTNISDSEVVIADARPSCHCTTAQLPSKPWHLLPHASGQINVSVDLKGKMGSFDKTIGIYFADTNAPRTTLRVTVKMPDRKLMRQQNTKIARADRQAVFKGDCAQCHADPAKTATGHALYREVCGICHDAHPRASWVPDLHFINHPTDLDYWKIIIANGKPNTMMPAFAASQGGPLSEAQIEALAKDCLRAMPYIPRTKAELDAQRSQPASDRAPKIVGTNSSQ